MPIIDFHTHMYPQEYVAALQAGPTAYTITYDEANNPVLHSPGDYSTLVPSHRLVEVRRRAIAESELDQHVITLPGPGTCLETPPQSVALSRLVNDLFARLQVDHGDRLRALGTLPMNVPEAAAAELERAIAELGLGGAMIFSNINGLPLSDERFWPLYEKADALEAVLYIHPTFPVGVEAMQDYMLVPLVGFLTDTTLATAGLIYSGVFERFPKIKWVLAHLGGAVPYLAERLDRGYEVYRPCRENISRPPSHYLKQLYYDTVNFDLKALQFAIDFVGADHLVAGSDYPQHMGSVEQMLTSINALNISAADKAGILGENAMRLLSL